MKTVTPPLKECKKRPSLWADKYDLSLIILYPDGTNEFYDEHGSSRSFITGGLKDYYPHPETEKKYSGYIFVDFL